MWLIQKIADLIDFLIGGQNISEKNLVYLKKARNSKIRAWGMLLD